jgi:hypothetical protein
MLGGPHDLHKTWSCIFKVGHFWCSGTWHDWLFGVGYVLYDLLLDLGFFLCGFLLDVGYFLLGLLLGFLIGFFDCALDTRDWSSGRFGYLNRWCRKRLWLSYCMCFGGGYCAFDHLFRLQEWFCLWICWNDGGLFGIRDWLGRYFDWRLYLSIDRRLD